ncbi:hypothetical protein CSUI_002279 [Cystoisospora suis]|uniref:BRCT domain-containing protein n=1 Tax=Cystoisospora suis TaxID=483139 RepID=A0A2C6L5B5_9APIC|nr:hypothetical protein CSUI_002279 [Cystoisospora suis]
MVSTGEAGLFKHGAAVLTKAIEQKLCTSAQLRNFASQEYAAVAKLLKVGEDLLVPAIREVKLQEISGQDLLAIPASKYVTALQLKTVQQRQFLTQLLDAVRDMQGSSDTGPASCCSSLPSASSSVGSNINPHGSPPSSAEHQLGKPRCGTTDGAASHRSPDEASAKSFKKERTRSRQQGELDRVVPQEDASTGAARKATSLSRNRVPAPRVPGLRQGLQPPKAHRAAQVVPPSRRESAAQPEVFKSPDAEKLQTWEETLSWRTKEQDSNAAAGQGATSRSSSTQHGGGRAQKGQEAGGKSPTVGSSESSTVPDKEMSAKGRKGSPDGRRPEPEAENASQREGGLKPGQSSEKNQGVVLQRLKRLKPGTVKVNRTEEHGSDSGRRRAQKSSGKEKESEERGLKGSEGQAGQKKFCSAAAAAEKAARSLLARIATASQEEKVRKVEVQKRLFYVCGERTIVGHTDEDKAQRKRKKSTDSKSAVEARGGTARSCESRKGEEEASDREETTGHTARSCEVRSAKKPKIALGVSNRRYGRAGVRAPVKNTVVTEANATTTKPSRTNPRPATRDSSIDHASKKGGKADNMGEVQGKRKRVATFAATESGQQSGPPETEARTNRTNAQPFSISKRPQKKSQGQGSAKLGLQPADGSSRAGSSQRRKENCLKKVIGGVLSCSGSLKGAGADDLAELCCRVCCTLPDVWHLRFERTPSDLEEITHLVVPPEQKRPTLKILFVLATGGHVLTPPFVEKADEEEVWPRSLGPFESLNFPTHSHRRVILPPLKGRRVAVAGNFPTNKGSLTRKILSRLIELCGAVLMNATEREPSRPEFLVCPPDFVPSRAFAPPLPSARQNKGQEMGAGKRSKQAGQVVSIAAGPEHSEGEKVGTRIFKEEQRVSTERVEVVTPQWIVECIRTWTLDPPSLHAHEHAGEISRFFGFAVSSPTQPKALTPLTDSFDSIPSVTLPELKKKAERPAKTAGTGGGRQEETEPSKLPARQLPERDALEGGTEEAVTKEDETKGKQNHKKDTREKSGGDTGLRQKGIKKGGSVILSKRSNGPEQMPLKGKPAKASLKKGEKQKEGLGSEKTAGKAKSMRGRTDSHDEQAVDDHADWQPHREEHESVNVKKETEARLGKNSKRGSTGPRGTSTRELSPNEQVKRSEENKEKEDLSRDEHENAKRGERQRALGKHRPQSVPESKKTRPSDKKNVWEEDDEHKEGDEKECPGDEISTKHLGGNISEGEDAERKRHAETGNVQAPAAKSGSEKKGGRPLTSRGKPCLLSSDAPEADAKQNDDSEVESTVLGGEITKRRGSIEQQKVDPGQGSASRSLVGPQRSRKRLRKYSGPPTSVYRTATDLEESAEKTETEEKTPRLLVDCQESRGDEEPEDAGGKKNNTHLSGRLPDTRKAEERDDCNDLHVERAFHLTTSGRSSLDRKVSDEEKGRAKPDCSAEDNLCDRGFGIEGAEEQAREPQGETAGRESVGTEETAGVAETGESSSDKLPSFDLGMRELASLQNDTEHVNLFAEDEEENDLSLARSEEEHGSQEESKQSGSRGVAGDQEIDDGRSDASDEFELGPSQLTHFHPPDIGSSDSEEEDEEELDRESSPVGRNRRTNKSIHEGGGVESLSSGRVAEEGKECDSSSLAVQRRLLDGLKESRRGEEEEKQSEGEDEGGDSERLVRAYAEALEHDEAQGDREREEKPGHESERYVNGHSRQLAPEGVLENRSGSEAENSPVRWEFEGESERSQGSWEREDETDREDL